MDGQQSLDLLRRRVRMMHSLYEDAVSDMDLTHVNHVEREPALPIAFSLFHLVQIEDSSVMLMGGPGPVWNEGREEALGLSIADHGKHRQPEEMVHQRIGNWEGYLAYQAEVFANTEGWLATLTPDDLDRVVIARPFPEQIASTFSARVAGEEGITVAVGIECWIYQHGMRHMGEIEHARAFVGLRGMTS